MTSIEISRIEDIQPPLAKKLKIDTNSDNDEVEFSDNEYDDYDCMSYSDDEDKEIDQQYQIFYSQFNNSEGFDINFREFNYKFGCYPVSWKELGLSSYWRDLNGGDLMKKLAVVALDGQCLKEGKKLKLVKVVKANWQPCTGINFFITCKVKDYSDGKKKTYQIEVQHFREEITVHMVREKPT